MRFEAVTMRMFPTGVEFSERIGAMYSEGFHIAASFLCDGGVAIVVWEREIKPKGKTA